MLAHETTTTSSTQALGSVAPQKSFAITRGYLKKQSPSMLHRWQNRYFVLVPETRAISYFKEQEDASDVGKRKGLIYVKDIKHIESRDEAEFHLICPERTYNLKASNRAERTKWISSIRALRQGQGQGQERLNQHIHHELQPSERFAHKDGAVIAKETVTTHETITTTADHHHHAGAEINTTQGYPGLVSSGSTISDGAHEDDIHYYSTQSQALESDANKMREFIVIERVIGGNGKEKTYRFTAPRNSEVNIKFTRAIAPIDVLSTTTTSTIEGNTFSGPIDTSKPFVSEGMTTSEYVSNTTVGYPGAVDARVQGYPGVDARVQGYPGAEVREQGYPGSTNAYLKDQTATVTTSAIQE